MRYSQSRLLHFGLTLPMGMVSVLHVIQSIMILTDDVGTTSIIGLAYNHPGDWVPLAIGEVVLAIAYIAFAALAFAGMWFSKWPFWAHCAAWAPQQLLVIMAAISATEAMWGGCYLDGFCGISREHLIADQSIYQIAALTHIISFLVWRFIIWQITEHENTSYAMVDRVREAMERTSIHGT